MVELSVIILNYKVPYYLLHCLESVSKSIQQISAEIIVVDNYSQDESCGLVKFYFPEVILIENRVNYGFSKGNNIGINKARGKYICLLNPDTLVGEETFKNFISFAQTKSDFGAIGPKLIDGGGNFLPESKRNLPTPKVALKKILNLEKDYYSDLRETEVGKVEILVGAFMFMQKDRFEEIGGLDEDYFMYGEDIDLSYKFLKKGYQNYYLGTENVIHYKGESTVKDKKYRDRFYGAMEIFYKKHFKKNNFLRPLIHLSLALAKSFFNPKPEQTDIINYEKIYWVSDSEINSGFNSLGKSPIEIINKKELKNKSIKNSKIIFDANYLTYTEIFSIMENHKMKQNYFRIKPLKYNFIIGSDHSKSQGEILKL
ncbi:glycosyltransferase family 2 protein [Mesonia aestuariivivens]|uniref:Glycosyltransferase family 2 protein n=1 Tax=Mesonia aestuariivivens TaxID=2796128 RepID=A0ABS6W6W5_9FLAO|nr:glycosyltransferase family 2 protein [Mesonia aestuariivivens]MBW2962879.1 glycosyltransferase family 2 protein [Mesonia aestuariivivens]